MPRPPGPFRLLDATELDGPLSASIALNRSLHVRYEELHGYEIVEAHPVALGGDPTELSNKRAVNWDTHAQLVRFWNRHIVYAGGQNVEHPDRDTSPCALPADYLILASADEDILVLPGGVYLHLWQARRSEAARILPNAPMVFGSDGSGTAFAVMPDDAGDCAIHALPFMPFDSCVGRQVGRTLSDLLDSLEADGADH